MEVSSSIMQPLTQASAQYTALMAQQAKAAAASQWAAAGAENADFLSNLTNLQPKSEDTGVSKSALGKDDFLKILITQLQNQDPEKPMEDREFIAQMAQFSSLEQMTNMSKGFDNVAKQMDRTFALSIIGKNVEIQAANADPVRGVVSEVLTGTEQKVKVNGIMYNADDIIRVAATEVQ